MAKMTLNPDMAMYLAKLRELGDSISVKHCIGLANYEGVKVMADAIRSGIESIPDSLVNETQRQGLRDGLGASKMKDKAGYLYIKIGFDGYNGEASGRYANNQAWASNSFVANRVEGGTSKQSAFPFVRRVYNANKSACEQAMQKKFEEVVADTMKE